MTGMSSRQGFDDKVYSTICGLGCQFMHHNSCNWVANSYTKTLLTGCLQKLQLGVSSWFHSVTPLLTHMHPAQHVDWLTIMMIMIMITTIIMILMTIQLMMS